MKDTIVKPAVYCGTYNKYNNGSLAGAWMSLEDYSTPEEFFKACRELHKDEDDPEFMFQDFEGYPEGLYSESMGLVDAARLFAWVKLDEDDRELLEEYADAIGSRDEYTEDVEAVRELFECRLDDIRQQYDNIFISNEKALAYHFHDSGLIEIPEHLEGYMDWEAIGRDYLQDMSVSSNGWVFRY